MMIFGLRTARANRSDGLCNKFSRISLHVSIAWLGARAWGKGIRWLTGILSVCVCTYSLRAEMIRQDIVAVRAALYSLDQKSMLAIDDDMKVLKV